MPSGKEPRIALARKFGRSHLILLGAAIVTAGILTAWFPAAALLHQRAGLNLATSNLHTLQQQDSALAKERANLSASTEIARIAREQYQLVSPGQVAYEVLPPSGSTAGTSPYAGDPSSQNPATPSAAVELPPGSTTATTVPTAGRSPSHASAPQGTLARILQTLEFWR